MSGKFTRFATTEELKLINTKTNFSPKEYKGKVLFFNGHNRFLVGKELNSRKKNLKYHLLGGTCETGETIVDCTAREIYEETIGLVPIGPVKEQLVKAKKQNVLVWKQKNGDRLVTQFVFVLPWVHIKGTSNLSEKFKQRRQVLDQVFDKNKVPAGKLNSEQKQKIHKELKLLDNPDRLSKSFLKHFHEFSSISWVSESELFDPESTNSRLVNKLSIVQSSNLKKFYRFSSKIKQVSIGSSKMSLIPKGNIFETTSYFELLKKKKNRTTSTRSTSVRSTSVRSTSVDSSGWKVVKRKR